MKNRCRILAAVTKATGEQPTPFEIRKIKTITATLFATLVTYPVSNRQMTSLRDLDIAISFKVSLKVSGEIDKG